MNKIKKAYRIWGIVVCIYLLLLYSFNSFMSVDISSLSEKEISLARKSNYTDFINYTNKVNSTSLLSSILIYSEDIDFIDKALSFYKDKGDLQMINQAVRVFEVVSSSQTNLIYLPESSISSREQKISMLKKQKVYNELYLYIFINKDYFYFFVSFILPIFIFIIIAYPAIKRRRT